MLRPCVTPQAKSYYGGCTMLRILSGLPAAPQVPCPFWKKLALGGLLSTSLLAVPRSSWATQVTVSWDGSGQAEVAGYKVYLGRAPRSYTTVVDAGNTTTTTLADLEQGRTYYLAVKTYGEGQESPYSAELVYHVPTPPAERSAQAQTATLQLSAAAPEKAGSTGVGNLLNGGSESEGVANRPQATGEADLTPEITEIPQTEWQLMYVDSEELGAADYAAVNAFDGDVTTIWRPQGSFPEPGRPHELQIDLGEAYDIRGFRYLPGQDGAAGGQSQGYEFYVSHDGQHWGRPVAKGMFASDGQEQEVQVASTLGRYIRLRVMS